MKDEINITVIASAFNDDVTLNAPVEQTAPVSNVEKVPSASNAAPTAAKATIDEDYSEFFNMINKR